ncbi:Acetate kinase [Acholeplasma oculi]|uniref:Acetate kinase n=1 Tax=Acholeplasma oculi TaxID=35623 RepID=W8GW49_9MOLU|nr:acetate kinase [Acholeplasma oculi]AHK23634.1 acetate kinase [Acholeplasma oculi]CDR30713.1 Acetate kinase [Acholeplasma oculi]SKC34722.1 acetate kinase [Acholeplasma oculi]SUT89553.1 Acetate kinase [Acholeplasma oculi]
MKILSVNAGSSSLKFQLLQMPEEIEISSGLVERIGNKNAEFTLKFNGNKQVLKDLVVLDHSVAVDLVIKGLLQNKVIQSLDEIDGVGHRVVQGGELFKDSVVIDDDVVIKIASLNDLAPLHNPANIIGINAFRKALPNVIQVAVFDTTFHQTMPKENFLYGVPYEWYEKHGVRKYGFHGTSHQYVSQLAHQRLNKENTKIIVAHIGNGASLTAVLNGKSIDTSMGLTPLEGFPMGTRSGNVDPAIFQLMQQKEGYSLEKTLNELNKSSGYLGISGISHDSRDIVQAAEAGNERAQLAIDIQAKRIADYIASYYVLLGGLDALVFTAGIGENAKEVREAVCKRVEVLGIKIDAELNNSRGDKEISRKDSLVKVWVIPTNEEVMIARDVIRLQKHN